MVDAAAVAAAAAAAARATAAAASTPMPLSGRFDPRRSHRSQFHARVRADALARQRAARGEGLEAARRSRMEQQQEQEQEGGGGDAAAGVEAEGEGRGASSPPSSAADASAAAGPPRPFWARQLMRHEWMVDVPEDLAASWLVLPRPEGIRCLLVSGRGKTVARGRNGAVLHEFASLLPGGGGSGSGGGRSGGGGGGTEGSCVLDAVFQPDQSSSLPAGGTFFALDVLAWGGRDLTGCDAAFRLSFWLPAKLAEAGCCRPCGPGSGPGPGVARVVPLSAAGASPEGILAAVAGGGSGSSGCGGGSPQDPGPVRDGVLFVHRESGYACDEASPLALVWKDASCSRYVVETDARGLALQRQGALLRVAEVRDEGGGVLALAATGDDPPVPLAPVPVPPVQTPSSSPEEQQLSFRPGRLLRFAVGPAGFSFGGSGASDADDADASAPSVSADLEFVAALPSSSNRLRGAGGGADTLSKLLFQHAARHGLLPTLEALLEAARRSRCPSPRGGESDDEAMNLG